MWDYTRCPLAACPPVHAHIMRIGPFRERARSFAHAMQTYPFKCSRAHKLKVHLQSALALAASWPALSAAANGGGGGSTAPALTAFVHEDYMAWVCSLQQSAQAPPAALLLLAQQH